MQSKKSQKDKYSLTKRISFLLDVCSQSEVKYIEEIVGNIIIDSLDDIIEEALLNKSNEILTILEKSANFLENKLDYHDE